MSYGSPGDGLFTFIGGETGPWRVMRTTAVIGAGLPEAPRLEVLAEDVTGRGHWSLRGTTSNARYAQRAELDALVARQEAIGRPEATRAVLIPIKKSAAWWALAQDERRAIFEAQSRHIALGLEALPQVARRLHHCRDLGEPFDFLTWFDFAPEHERVFDDLLAALRATREWDFVEREVEVRVARD